MTGLDTNILVRYLARDDEDQLRLVLDLLLKKNATFFVSDLVVVETSWVMLDLYDWTAQEVADAWLLLLTTHNLEFEDEPRLRRALRAVKSGADLPDELILDRCRQAGCRRIASFDKSMARRHASFVVVPK